MTSSKSQTQPGDDGQSGTRTGWDPVNAARAKNLADAMGISEELAGSIMTICSVTQGMDLYARYVAAGRADLLFARAIGVSPEEWVQWMERLRSSLPAEIVARIEKPLSEKELPRLSGYRPPHREQGDTEDDQADSGNPGEGDSNGRESGWNQRKPGED